MEGACTLRRGKRGDGEAGVYLTQRVSEEQCVFEGLAGASALVGCAGVCDVAE